MQKLMNLITLVIVIAGGYFVYQRFSSMGPESAPSAPPPAPATAPASSPATPAPAQTAQAPAALPAAAPTAPLPQAPSNLTSPDASTNMPAVVANAPVIAANTPAATTLPPAAPAPASEPPPAPAPTPAVNMPTLNAAVLQQVTIVNRGAGSSLGGFQQQNVLQQLKPEDWVAELPEQGQVGFVNARNAYNAGAGIMPINSWLSVWRNQLREPKRTLLELDYIKLLLQNRGQFINPQDEKAAKQNNVRTAKMMIQSIRLRGVTDQEVMDMVNKQEDQIDDQLKTFK